VWCVICEWGARPLGGLSYLGNDLHTVTQVWQCYLDVEAYVAANPAKATFWGVTKGTSGEKAEQSRLRQRRRKLWHAVIQSAKQKDINMSEADTQLAVVAELDQLQASLRAGISRVECWAADALKAEDGDICEMARKYASTRPS
jgi:hypothetical protein